MPKDYKTKLGKSIMLRQQGDDNEEGASESGSEKIYYNTTLRKWEL